MPVGHVEKDTVALRARRRRRIRGKIRGTAECPRLSVFRSSQHIYVQIIDDDRGHTLVQCSSREVEIDGSYKTVAAAEAVGKELAARATSAGIERVAFDRGGYLYHGRVKALANGAREGGLRF